MGVEGHGRMVRHSESRGGSVKRGVGAISLASHGRLYDLNAVVYRTSHVVVVGSILRM